MQPGQMGMQQQYGHQQLTQQQQQQSHMNQQQQHLNQQQMNQQHMNQQQMNQQQHQNQQSGIFGNTQQSTAFGGQNSMGMNSLSGQQAFSGQNANQSFGMSNSVNRMQHKGVPQVIPTVGQPLNMQQQQQQNPQNPNATGPNLMQKLNEITAPGGDILSKGKELIFMKFGLGGK